MSKVLTNSRNAEVGQVMKDIIAASKKSDWSADVYLPGIISEIIPISERMSGAVNRDVAESQKAELDGKRDKTFTDITSVVVGYMANPIPSIRAAAVKVNAVIEKYGLSIVREIYIVETSLIDSFLRDIAELEEEVGELPGLENLIVQLTEDQAAFDESHRSFTSEKAVEGVLESATDIKKEALELLNGKFYHYLNGMNYVNEQMYGAFAREVAEIIERNNSAVKKRLAQ